MYRHSILKTVFGVTLLLSVFALLITGCSKKQIAAAAEDGLISIPDVSKTMTNVVEVDASVKDGLVRIPVSDISDGRVHFFSYTAGGKKIKYFVIKSSDDVFRAAFNACDVCYPARKGYRQEGDFLVCNNCGQSFASVNVNVLRGGCNPAPLNRAVQGEYLVIETSDIEGGSRYF
ncbi:MAG: DUF2318 domain-containing protein [Chloroflexota bacterium]